MDFEGKMNKETTVKEFRDTGLLMYINQILQIFGWEIGVRINISDNETQQLIPLRTKFRGFDNQTTTRNYEKIASWIRKNGDELYDEAEYDQDNGKKTVSKNRLITKL